MAEVDAESIIDERAELAPDVAIGARCVLTGHVVIGTGTRLADGVSIHGPVRIGPGNELAEGVCVGFAPQDLKFDPEREGAGVVIGEGNRLEPRVTIHRATGATPTRLGDRNELGPDSHMGHDVVVGDGCVLGVGVLLAGHVTLGDGVRMEPGAVVHQFCRVGRLARQGERAGVTQDIPPFCRALHRRIAGLNTEGLEAASLAKHVGALNKALELIYRSGLTPASAAERIRSELGDDPLCLELVAFVESSERGLCGWDDA